MEENNSSGLGKNIFQPIVTEHHLGQTVKKYNLRVGGTELQSKQDSWRSLVGL